METITIEEKQEGIEVTVHPHQKPVRMPQDSQSVEIVTQSGQHWYISQVDGQSFTRVNYKSLKIRLVKVWSILRGKGWWERLDIKLPS